MADAAQIARMMEQVMRLSAIRCRTFSPADWLPDRMIDQGGRLVAASDCHHQSVGGTLGSRADGHRPAYR
jgi:hypothetical protein